MILQNLDVKRAANAWSSLSGAVFVPHTEAEYNRIVALLDRLIDQVGEDENHPLASLMEVLSVLVERYETEHVPKSIARLDNEQSASEIPSEKAQPTPELEKG